MTEQEEFQALVKKMDDGVLAKKLENDPEWILVKEIAQKIADRSRTILTKLGLEIAQKISVTPEERSKVAQLNANVKLFGDFVQNLTKTLYDEGEIAFDLGKELGLFENNVEKVD
jgi:hypothetical protein